MEPYGEYLRRPNRRRPRSQNHRRTPTHELNATMSNLPIHPPALRHLSSDPVSGIPYYYHSADTLTPFPHPTVALTSSVAEVPGNMLGARARAAEYNAAKAATARQQANRESEELGLPPKPAPISLSAFTRAASYSRNRGAKSFIPLILSEEEEKKSTNSVDLANEADQIDLPQADPVPRPASLPPPQTTSANKNDQETSVQTPLRYTSPRSQINMYSTATRPVYYDDGYNFSNMGTTFHPQQFAPYQQAQPFPSHPNLIPSSNSGWYPPSNYYGGRHSYHDAGVFSIPRPTEPLPRLHHHNLSQDSATAPEPTKESSSEPAPDSTHPTTPVIRLGGPTLHTFGPDDLSPTKIEIKQRNREEYFTKNPPHETVAATITPARQTTGHNPAATNSRMLSGNIQNLLIDHDSVAPVRVRRSSINTIPFPKLEDSVRSEPMELGATNTVWSTSSPSRRYQLADLSDGSPIRHGRSGRIDVSEGELGGCPFNEIPPAPETRMIERSQTRSPSPSDDSQWQAAAEELERQRCEQDSLIQSLLIHTNDPDWYEIRDPTGKDRQRLKMLKKAMATKSTLPSGPSLFKIKHEELQGPFQPHSGEYERRRRRIQDLADEMRHKWEHGGEFRGPTMTKSQAESQTGRIKEIGHMMIMLSMQADSRDGSYHLGSRPYSQPPEYAIERSVGTDKDGATSLFEHEGHEGRAPPPRLARDPRFRAQLSEGVKIRGDEERIPRMFVARSRVQT